MQDPSVFVIGDVATRMTAIAVLFIAVAALAALYRLTRATEQIARVMASSHNAEIIGMKALWQAGLDPDETYEVAAEIKRRREARLAREGRVEDREADNDAVPFSG